MFEPLYKATDNRTEMQYLGSVGSIDMYLDLVGDLRMYTGPNSIAWDFCRIGSNNSVTRISDDEDISRKDIILMKRYLKLFVPDLYERSRNMLAVYRAQDYSEDLLD